MTMTNDCRRVDGEGVVVVVLVAVVVAAAVGNEDLGDFRTPSLAVAAVDDRYWHSWQAQLSKILLLDASGENPFVSSCYLLATMRIEWNDPPWSSLDWSMQNCWYLYLRLPFAWKSCVEARSRAWYAFWGHSPTCVESDPWISDSRIQSGLLHPTFYLQDHPIPLLKFIERN